MVPSVSDPSWLKLISGEKAVPSSNVSLNMLLFNVRLRYRNDSSAANAEALIRQTQEFFVKFEPVLKDEMNALLAPR